MKRATSALVLAYCLLLGSSCSEKSKADSNPAGSPVPAPSSSPAGARNPQSFFGGNDPSLWKGFIPRNVPDPDIILTQEKAAGPSGQPPLRMHTNLVARYGITLRDGAVAVVPGQRYRMSAHIRADRVEDEQAPERSTLLRAMLFTQGENELKEFKEGHYYVGLKGTLFAPTSAKFGIVPTPLTWSKVEGVFEIPPGVTWLVFIVFGWGHKMIDIDHPILERVADDTPLSPLL